ncbi:hypothetical protein KBW98_22660, partial [Massilia sp. ST3]|nr:hypothetical protein [Massilia sp. ST3]
AVAAAPVVAAAAPAVKKEAKKEKTPTPVVRKPASKKTPVRSVARRETPRASRLERPPPRTAPPAVVRAEAASPQAPARADTPPADGALAETLRQCRAAGYHATLCIKRGCSATKFGLACRG